MKKFRVALTCWAFESIEASADDLHETELSLFDTQSAAQKIIEQKIEEERIILNSLESDNPRKKEPVRDSDGNIVSYEYPFRGDFDGDYDGIIRFWDGEDYRNVTGYNIYELNGDAVDLEKCSYFKYRNFYILPNENHSSFKVEKFDITIFKSKSLQAALRYVDEICLIFETGKSKGVNNVENARKYENATYIQYWDTGAELHFPCKVDMQTKEVFDVEIVSEFVDSYEILQGEYIRLLNGETHQINHKHDANGNEFWISA